MPTIQVVTNLNTLAMPVKIDTARGGIDFVHLQPRATVSLPVGATVNKNWLASAQKIKIRTEETTEEDA